MTLFVLSSFSQDRVIHGVITTFDSIPLFGVNVKIKSTNQIVLTDSMGLFAASVNPLDMLTIKAGGFYSQKVQLKDKTRYVAINLKLKPGMKNRKYAIGYGHVTDENKLNALDNLTSNDMDFSQYKDVFDLIIGRFAGVQIINGEIIIRGINTFNASSAALIIVDGIPFSNSALKSLPPSQIESINIIKDGSSAIYGSRGANGVVLIETKRGGD